MHVDVYTGYNISEAVAAGGGGRGDGGGGGICPRAPVEGGRRQDVILKKILSCLTKINKFDENERIN